MALSKSIAVSSLALIFAIAHAQVPQHKDDGQPSKFPGLADDSEPATERVTQIESLLLKGDFDRLDKIANKNRADKARVAGGVWRLKTFYGQLNTQQEAAQNADTQRQQLEAWVKVNPESVTARIGLAEFYLNYAWVARGGAEADKVPEAAWPVFKARAKKAEDILNEAATLSQKCPEWYVAMETAALALDWEKPRMKALFEQGIQFEPSYQYIYEHYANYLLPKWDGSAAESIQFAKQAADQIGGERGDITYFFIATVEIKSNNGNYRPQLDWERIQRGHAALETIYGSARAEQNKFAFIAYRYRDAAVAKKAFAAIGDKWQPSVWRNRAAFDKARTWASHVPA